MPQVLELIKKADRNQPAVYKFGGSERLNIHFEDNYADITDASTGAYIRYIGWDSLRDWGYSPAKLLAGNEVDQFIDSNKVCFFSHAKSCAKHVIAGLAAAVVIVVISNTTGCTNYLAKQLNQDMKTSTVYPRMSITTQKEDPELLAFREKTAYANKKMKEMNLYAMNGSAK